MVVETEGRLGDIKKTGGILTVEGLDTSKPAEYIDNRKTPDCQNIFIDRMVLAKRCGTTVMGGVITGTQKEIMAGREFERSGVKYIVRIGLDRIEEWNDTTSAWDNITGTDLTGTTNDPVCCAVPVLSGERILVFTNGVDAIRKWNATGNTAVLGGSPPVCKFLIEYKTYLILANIENYVQRVQWSDTGASETWTGGNAKSIDLIEDGEAITGLGVFGDYITVHKKSCIYVGYLVGSSQIFVFNRKSGSGCVCNATIKELPTGEQIYLAVDGLRIFNGITSAAVEGITEELKEQINPEYVHKCWSVIVKELNEYWVGVPLGSQTSPDTIYKYNYKTGQVHKDIRTSITAAWGYTQAVQPSWADMTGSWDSMGDVRWNTGILLKLFPIVMFGDSSGYCYKRDDTKRNDNNIAVDGWWSSKDYESAEIGRLCQWLEARIWAKGNTMDFEYSTDEGQTWAPTLDSPFTLDPNNYPADNNPLIAYFNVVNSKIRVRFRNKVSGEYFAVKRFIISYRNREMLL